MTSTATQSLREVIADNLRVELARSGKTQSELAEELQRDRSWVSRRLAAGLPFTDADIDSIAGALGISTNRLTTRPPASRKK